jgi:RNA polymerase sigma factor (sigma-70 family)
MAQPLTDEQARLVNDNLGLVGVHLRRHVANLRHPRRDREWEDLFQEGCLGLIEAAIRHDPEKGIPFAAFALPRIHNAVSKALNTKFDTVYVPPRRKKGDCGLRISDCGFEAATESAFGNPQCERRDSKLDRPKTYSLSHVSEAEVSVAPGHSRHNPEPESGETVGGRLREKYESAVKAAAESVARKKSARDDRDKLVRILTEERFLVPHDDARRPLRQIARDTQSSYARVAQCDKRLSDKIRRALQADPEFCELERHMRTDPLGGDVPIDEDIERGLASASADEFVRRFHDADANTRAGVLHAVLEMSNGDIESLVRRQFERLSRPTQTNVLSELQITNYERSLRQRPRVRNS